MNPISALQPQRPQHPLSECTQRLAEEGVIRLLMQDDDLFPINAGAAGGILLRRCWGASTALLWQQGAGRRHSMDAWRESCRRKK